LACWSDYLHSSGGPIRHAVIEETGLKEGDPRPGFQANQEHVLVDLRVEEMALEEINCASLRGCGWRSARGTGLAN
jgi:hypothetical protein